MAMAGFCDSPRFRRKPVPVIVAGLIFFAAMSGLIFFVAPLFSPLTNASQVIIKWSTRREVKTAGYHLYRADTSGGPFVPIHHEMISAANDPYLGGTYVFTDTATIAGVTYFYQLEDVDLDGVRTRHDPIGVTARVSSPTILGQPITWMNSIIAFALAGIGLLVGTMIWCTYKSE
jgi:hypothetical protein